MPYIQCDLAEQLAAEQKRELTEAIVDVVHKSIGSAIRHINVVIRDLPPENIVEGGRSSADDSAAG